MSVTPIGVRTVSASVVVSVSLRQIGRPFTETMDGGRIDRGAISASMLVDEANEMPRLARFGETESW